jgi:hypothetical protein
MSFSMFYTVINDKITFSQSLKYSTDNSSYYKDYNIDLSSLYENEHIIKS